VSKTPVFFVIPGDLSTVSGGYGYDRRLIEELRAQGKEVTPISLGSSFPNPTPEDTLDAAEKLASFPGNSLVIIDGLALGALEPEALAQLKAPLVALVHHPLAFEGGLSKERSDQLYQNEKENLKLASRVVVTSPSTAELLIAEYDVPSYLITIARPGTDQKTMSGNRVDPPLILSVGIQVPRKGHDVLLLALSRISHLPWQAAIAGPVSDLAYGRKLIEMIDELGFKERVKLLGQVSSDELSILYSQASIFALATRFEGYGMVFGEAMASGLPIVSSRTGAVPDTVPEDAGVLVSADDPEAFAEALGNILQNETLRSQLAHGSAAAGEKLISWEQTASLVRQALDDVTDNKLNSGLLQEEESDDAKRRP